jgi:hypothetical protein
MNLMSETVTNPETAWIALAVPVWLAVAGMLGATLVARGRLATMLQAMLTRRATVASDPALAWVPPIADAGRLVGAALASAILVTLVLSQLAPVLLAALLAGPAGVLIAWALLHVLELRYRDALDRALPAAVGRLAARLRSGASFQAALARVVADLPEGPLRAEWGFVVERLGVPLADGGPAQPAQVVRALADQTASARHTVFLEHLEVALGQPHDVLTQRTQAASEALYAAELRRSAATTELAQMRYSGMAIGLAGTGMAGYLAATQVERVARAYEGPLGLVVGMIVVVALGAPFVAGHLLSQANDLDY